jgi:tight adherence protein C
MSSFRLFALAILFAAVAVVVLLANRSREGRIDKSEFERAYGEEESVLTRGVLRFAQPLSGLARAEKRSTLYEMTEGRISAAGGAYAGSVEVFLTVQLVFALVGTAVMLLGVAGLIWPVLALLFGPALAVWPWDNLRRRAAKRQARVEIALPEFVELLIMPLTGGITLLASLDFTAQRTNSVVAEEVRNMLTVIRSRAATEADAFLLCGERLGTQQAKSLMTSLLQSHLEGTRILETLSRQAESLRNTAYQRQREEMKKLPLKLIGVFAVHLLPTVFAVIGLQTISAFMAV